MLLKRRVASVMMYVKLFLSMEIVSQGHEHIYVYMCVISFEIPCTYLPVAYRKSYKTLVQFALVIVKVSELIM
jgi:hypothetical protein